MMRSSASVRTWLVAVLVMLCAVTAQAFGRHSRRRPATHSCGCECCINGECADTKECKKVGIIIGVVVALVVVGSVVACYYCRVRRNRQLRQNALMRSQQVTHVAYAQPTPVMVVGGGAQQPPMQQQPYAQPYMQQQQQPPPAYGAVAAQQPAGQYPPPQQQQTSEGQPQPATAYPAPN
jgi:hypothetical protein